MARGGKRAGAGRKPNAAGKKAREVSDLTHGGRRAGAGRTLGAATKKTRAIADQAAAEGITPLEVMLNTMRAALLEGDLPFAVSIARDAAPYCHPRLSAITVKENIDDENLDVSTMTDQELEASEHCRRHLQEAGKPPGAVH